MDTKELLRLVSLARPAAGSKPEEVCEVVRILVENMDAEALYRARLDGMWITRLMPFWTEYSKKKVDRLHRYEDFYGPEAA